MKICSKCKIKKEFSEFYKNKCAKDGLNNQCKACHKQWYSNNKEKSKEYMKQYNAKYYQTHKEEIKQCEKQYRKIHKEEKKQYYKQYQKNHKKELNQYLKEYNKKRRESNINYKIACNLRIRLGQAIKGNFKSGSAVRDLGMSIPEFKIYFKPKFYFIAEANKMMSWENHGKLWHIDHIIPLSLFDLSDPVQFKKAVHYSNLQLLWAKDNLSKGKKLYTFRSSHGTVCET